MSDNKKNYLAFISFSYAIGTILVVLGHSYPLGNAIVPKTMLYLRSWIYSFHMPLFFFISGFLMKHIYSEKHLHMAEYFSFIKIKAIKLLSPYFILGLVAFIPKYLVSEYLTDNVSLKFTYFVKTFLVPRDNIWGHFWFIPVLFILFCCSFVMLKSLQKIWAAILLTCLFVILYSYPINIVWFGIKDVCQYGLYFWIGIVSRDFIVENQNRLFSLASGIYSALAAIILFTVFPFLIKILSNNNRVAVLLIALLMIYSILSFGVVYQRKGYIYLDWMKQKIFTIFLLSWPFQAVVEICLNKIFKLNWFLVMPVMFLVGICGPLIVVWFYENLNIKNKFLRIQVGIN